MNEFKLASKSLFDSVEVGFSESLAKEKSNYSVKKLDAILHLTRQDKQTGEILAEIVTNFGDATVFYRRVDTFATSLWLVHQLKTEEGEEIDYHYFLQNFPYLLDTEPGETTPEQKALNRTYETLRLDRELSTDRVYYGRHGGADEVNEEILALFLNRARITGVKEKDLLDHIKKSKLSKRELEEEFLEIIKK